MMLVGMMTMTATSTKTMAVTLMVVEVAVEKMYIVLDDSAADDGADPANDGGSAW